MAYLGTLAVLISAYGLWLIWRKKLERSRRFLWLGVWAVILPFLINTAGWLLTESGRQPWIVQGLMLTEKGVSPSVSSWQIATSLLVFLLLYGALAVVSATLMVRYGRREVEAVPETTNDEGAPLPTLTY